MSETETRGADSLRSVLRRQRDEFREEARRLRAVVEAVQALADAAEVVVGPFGPPTRMVHAPALLHALAPVSSSGEAESGDNAATRLMQRGLDQMHEASAPAPVSSGVPDLLAALGSAVERARQDRRPAPVLSGGQADGQCTGQVGCPDGCGGVLDDDPLAARPVLSREALTAAILGARDGGGNLVEYLSASTAGVLADAILAAEAGAR